MTLLEDLSFSIFSSLDPFDSADAPLRVTLEEDDSTDELEVPVSSELADEESSQAERAKNAANKKMARDCHHHAVSHAALGAGVAVAGSALRLLAMTFFTFFIKHPRLVFNV